MTTCNHRDAQYRCESCIRRVRAAMPLFPLLEYPRERPGPTRIPWDVADRAYATYSGRYGTYQSVERLAERGGFSWGEMDDFLPSWRQEVTGSR